MTKERLVTVPVGTTLEEAKQILHEHRIEKLPVVDADGLPARADHGQGHPEEDPVPERLYRRRAAACAWAPRSGSPTTSQERAQELVRQGVDLLVLDSAHGHSTRVMGAWRRSARSPRRSTSSAATSPRSRRPRNSSSWAPTSSRWAWARGRSARPGSWPASAFPRSRPSWTAPRWRRSSAAGSSPTAGIRYSGDITKAIAAGASAR